MTIAATATTDYAVDDLVKMAYFLNGFGPNDPTSGQLQLGRQILSLGLASLANDGILLRARERLELLLTAGVNYVSCPADTLTVEKGGYVTNTAGTAISIDPLVLEDYNALPNKGTAGMPTRYFPEQQSDGTWRVYLWPVPTGDFPTIVLPRTRKTRDVNTGNVTLDFDPKWHLAIVKFLQSNIARSMGRRDLASELMIEYREERERASANETERGDGMFTLADDYWD